MKFESTEQFEQQAHKCFGRIFELMQKVDGVIKPCAEEEEAQGKYGQMCEVRDWAEEIILQCHLAWQYHRLAMGPLRRDTWDQLEKTAESESASDGNGAM